MKTLIKLDVLSFNISNPKFPWFVFLCQTISSIMEDASEVRTVQWEMLPRSEQ